MTAQEKIKEQEEPLKIYDICSSCAKELGGVWPDNHNGWFNEAICDFCKNKCTVCSRRNWGLTIDGKKINEMGNK